MKVNKGQPVGVYFCRRFGSDSIFLPPYAFALALQIRVSEWLASCRVGGRPKPKSVREKELSRPQKRPLKAASSESNGGRSREEILLFAKASE